MKKQPHSWKEYHYCINGDNDNNRMWIRDNQRIHQISNGMFTIAVDKETFGDIHYNSFEEAQTILDNDN